jgi:hypothetical protein
VEIAMTNRAMRDDVERAKALLDEEFNKIGMDRADEKSERGFFARRDAASVRAIVTALTEHPTAQVTPALPTEAMIEAGARAIAQECDPDIDWHEYAASEQQSFRRRAVKIAALLTTSPREVNGDASEPPLSSEQRQIAGADHAPGSAAKDGSEAPTPHEGKLVEALTKCRNKFLHYEQLHRLKCTSEGDEKADRNRDMADMCDEALATQAGQRE